MAPGNIVEVDPSFTPDGRRSLFNTFNGEFEAIWSMKLDGTERRLIKTGPTADPNVSPNGRRLAFMGFDGTAGGPGAVHQRRRREQPDAAHAVQLQRRLQA
jgi:Tol biopolymer transport system component